MKIIGMGGIGEILMCWGGGLNDISLTWGGGAGFQLLQFL